MINRAIAIEVSQGVTAGPRDVKQFSRLRSVCFRSQMASGKAQGGLASSLGPKGVTLAFELFRLWATEEGVRGHGSSLLPPVDH